MKGDNVTLEWRYTVGGGQPYSQVIFASEIQIMDKYSTFRPPWIRSSYKGRLLVNITNDYTSIILLGVKRTDQGSYRLKIVNQDRDRTESRKVDIFVLYLDQPDILLTDNRPVEGTKVTLNCAASGKPDPTISWTVNGSPLHASGNSGISFRNGNKELTMMNLNKTDSGEYQCVAHNILGNISSNASTLSVQYQPEVALNPLNTTKAEGENITWSCTITGDPEPKISWMFNGSRINITYSPNTFFSNDRQKMTITNVSRTERGEYQCLASNMLGNTSSQVATLDVIYIPGITSHPQNETRREGDNATFICNAIGNPVPKISWNKGGAPLRNNSRVSLSADNKHLAIANVSRVDSGAYRCVAINSLGNDTSNPAYLGVLCEPAVKDLPERTIFQVGDVLVLTCEATGDPKPSVTWSKDGNTSIPRAQFRNDDHILVIQEVAPSDGGIYECRASNIFGQRRTVTAVIIAVPPSIMKDVSPRSVLCAKETSCSLLCHATSDFPFNYSWTRNGQALDSHNIKVMNSSVIITPLDDQDFGDYVCHATNSFGSTTYKITLSESREEENIVQSIFRVNDIIWSWIVFLLLLLIGVLIWRLRRAQASNRSATAKKATIGDTVQSVFPLEQHASEPGSYMELRPRPSEGQTRVSPEYQSLQGSHVNTGYYNVVPEEGNKRGSNEEIYEEIELSDC